MCRELRVALREMCVLGRSDLDVLVLKYNAGRGDVMASEHLLGGNQSTLIKHSNLCIRPKIVEEGPHHRFGPRWAIGVNRIIPSIRPGEAHQSTEVGIVIVMVMRDENSVDLLGG